MLIFLFTLQLGTIVSAYGYWYPSRKTQSKNEEGVKLMGKKLKNKGNNVKEDAIKVQNKYAQQDFQEEAGLLGTLMQMAYLVHSKSSLSTMIFCSSSTFSTQYFMRYVFVLNISLLLCGCICNTSLVSA